MKRSEVAWADHAADHVGDRVASSPLPDHAAAVDLVVVGLGASGLEAARHAADRGAEVVAVDAVGIAAGAAGRNGGFLLAGLAEFHHDAVARHGRETAVTWFRRTEAELDRVAEAHPDLVRRTGSLRIAASDDELADIEVQLAAMRRDGLVAEPYDGPEGAGLLVPGDAVVNPAARCQALARLALAAGARLHAPVRVTELIPTDDGVAVHTVVKHDVVPRGDRTTSCLSARAVVVAVDGGLERLLPELRGRVRTSRLQMLATAPADEVLLPRPVYRRWGYDYVQQLPTGELLLGGGRDRHADREWGAPARPDDAVQRHLDGWLDELGVTAPVTHRWAAHAAFTDDRMPVTGEVRPGVHVVGAYSGHGNLLGPLLARGAVDAALQTAFDDHR